MEKRPKPRDTSFAEDMGKNIARYHEALGVSQEDLGFLDDLHRTAVGHLERGERTARADTASSCADRLGSRPRLCSRGSAGPRPITAKAS